MVVVVIAMVETGSYLGGQIKGRGNSGQFSRKVAGHLKDNSGDPSKNSSWFGSFFFIVAKQ